jgi:hypothetical protein
MSDIFTCLHRGNNGGLLPKNFRVSHDQVEIVRQMEYIRVTRGFRGVPRRTLQKIVFQERSSQEEEKKGRVMALRERQGSVFANISLCHRNFAEFREICPNFGLSRKGRSAVVLLSLSLPLLLRGRPLCARECEEANSTGERPGLKNCVVIRNAPRQNAQLPSGLRHERRRFRRRRS